MYFSCFLWCLLTFPVRFVVCKVQTKYIIHPNTYGTRYSLDQKNFTTKSIIQCIGACVINIDCCTATYSASSKLCLWDSDCCPITVEEAKQEETFVTSSEGYVYMSAFQGYVKFNKIFAPWTKARQKCQSEQADLVVLDTKEKNDEISMYLGERNDCTQWWIGANDIMTEGEFVWVNDVKLDNTYKSWKQIWGEPNDKSGKVPGADCASIIKNLSNNGKWFDKDCDDPLPFICLRQI